MSGFTTTAVKLADIAIAQSADGKPPRVILRFTAVDGRRHRHLILGNIFRTVLGLFRLGSVDNITAGLLAMGIVPSPTGLYPSPHQLLELQSGTLLDLGNTVGNTAARDLVLMLRDKQISEGIELAVLTNQNARFKNPHA